MFNNVQPSKWCTFRAIELYLLILSLHVLRLKCISSLAFHALGNKNEISLFLKNNLGFVDTVLVSTQIQINQFIILLRYSTSMK